jgi:hypothetical protein
VSLPGIPRETGQPEIDVHTIYLFLQRLKDGLTDTVTTLLVDSTFSQADAQDAVGLISQDSTTVDVTYTTPNRALSYRVIPNKTVQQVEVAVDGLLKGTHKRINFLQQGHLQLTIADDTLQDQTLVRLNPYQSRLVTSLETPILQDTCCVNFLNYCKIQGTLTLQGDSTMRIS